ncbi:C-type lectin domain-containing protein 162-like, partial [Haliotis asinina]|uniref:C-type lectin domain-containing protein 162-like n=1 Tax=Haliotis asinina TaxID=109174 RepID=UPI0035326984
FANCLNHAPFSPDATRFFLGVKEEVDHVTAVARCHDLGMTLAIVDSEVTLTSMRAVVPAEAWVEYWIGLKYTSGTFWWADNSVLTWSRWNTGNGEPNNMETTQQCVATNTDGGYRWYTRECGRTHNFICSKDLDSEYFTEMSHQAPASVPMASFPVANEMHCVASCRRVPGCYFVTVEVSAWMSTCSTYNYSTFQAGLTTSSRDSWIPVYW